MSEAETIATLNDISEVAGMFISMWVSFTFAYLTVAYFVGKALSTFQCLTISALYGVTASYFAGASIGHIQAWHMVRTSRETMYNNIWIMTSEAGWT